MTEVLAFSRVLNVMDQKGSSRLDPLSFMEMLVWFLYKLVEASRIWQPQSFKPGRQYEEVASLGMLAFMTTLLPEYARAPNHTSYPLLCRRLKIAIQNLHTTQTLEENRQSSLLLLWVLFIGGVTVMKGKELLELVPLILETSNRLQMHDWSVVQDELCRFPWIRALHDGPGLTLWECSRQQSIRTSAATVTGRLLIAAENPRNAL